MWGERVTFLVYISPYSAHHKSSSLSMLRPGAGWSLSGSPSRHHPWAPATPPDLGDGTLGEPWKATLEVVLMFDGTYMGT